jgi:DNA-binding beta-propeller fold protein YncE
MIARCTALLLTACLLGCNGSAPPAPAASPTQPSPVATQAPAPSSVASATPATALPVASAERAVSKPTVLVSEPLALPGAVAPVALDYLFSEPERARIWVPAGGSGSVDVFDPTTHAFTRIEGFKTAEREGRGKKRVVGPSSGSVGQGVAYIGNRATDEVCEVNLQTLKLGVCLKLPSSPDGVEYVAATHEVWVTTPRTQSLTLLDASKAGSLKLKGSIKLDGEPEGYAVDETRGLFLTNLEDKGSTLAIDLKSHALKDTWQPSCGSDGPRGLALDSSRGLLLVACTDHVQALDMAHGGALLARLDTGGGLDNLDFVPQTGLLYAACGKAARLTVARVGDHGELAVVATGETAPGARNAVVDASGNAYVADSQGARLLLLRAGTQ